MLSDLCWNFFIWSLYFFSVVLKFSCANIANFVKGLCSASGAESPLLGPNIQPFLKISNRLDDREGIVGDTHAEREEIALAVLREREILSAYF